MLAYYHKMFPNRLEFLPVVPYYKGYITRRPFCDFRFFMPTGAGVGRGAFLSVDYYNHSKVSLNLETALSLVPDLPVNQSSADSTGSGLNSVSVYSIFDPGSYGQSLGGTHKRRGQDVGFVDTAHIVGQSKLVSKCIPEMLCTNISRRVRSTKNDNTFETMCFTAPFVKCGMDLQYTPILNLHVHSKIVHSFLSHPCDCPTDIYSA
jgi:hypothetical protein